MEDSLFATGVAQAWALMAATVSVRAMPEVVLRSRQHRRAAALTGDAIALPVGAVAGEFEPDDSRHFCVPWHAKVGADHSLDVVGLQVGWCRLLELRDKFVSHVSHDWFWRASPAHGPVVRPAEFTMVVQLWIDISRISWIGTFPSGVASRRHSHFGCH